MADPFRTHIDGANSTHLTVVEILVDVLGCEEWHARQLDALLGKDLGFDPRDGAEIAKDIEIEFGRTPEQTAALLMPDAGHLRVRDVIAIADATDPYAAR